ncbi:hypothetical protein CASFOL_042808 [Castilleja foliolosa]|uniref:Uncharacterized protein n=1 Tax=Castilleja foliolosa TaxID=1961234 RepID=A0ABD3B8D2_9LAMI
MVTFPGPTSRSKAIGSIGKITHFTTKQQKPHKCKSFDRMKHKKHSIRSNDTWQAENEEEAPFDRMRTIRSNESIRSNGIHRMNPSSLLQKPMHHASSS